jgi:hypothetical protein
VLSFNPDNDNEGVPDWWRESWFGNPKSDATRQSRANDDPDGDGFTNIEEWRMDSDPKHAEPGALVVTSFCDKSIKFQGRAYDSYELLKSMNMVNWVPAGTFGVASETGIGTVPAIPSASREFYKLRRMH